MHRVARVTGAAAVHGRQRNAEVLQDGVVLGLGRSQLAEQLLGFAEESPNAAGLSEPALLSRPFAAAAGARPLE